MLPVAATFTRREIPMLLGVTVLFTTMALFGHEIGRLEGLLLVAGLGVFLFLSYRAATTEPVYREEVAETMAVAKAFDAEIAKPSRQIWIDLLYVAVGIAAWSWAPMVGCRGRADRVGLGRARVWLSV